MVLLCLTWQVIGPAAAAKKPPKNALQVLFIGNSYTFVNDLPGEIRELANAAGVKRPFHSESETPPGCTLEKHFKDGRAVERIQHGEWDYVVLQDQSQRLSFQPWQLEEQVYPFARKLHANIVEARAEPLFFLTWGRQRGDHRNDPLDTFEQMQARLDRGYGRIASELGAPVAPVGRAWRLAVRARPDLVLWSGDGSHPSVAGTYLAACVFFEALYPELSVVGNAYRGSLSASDASFLQETAREAKASWRDDGWGS